MANWKITCATPAVNHVSVCTRLPTNSSNAARIHPAPGTWALVEFERALSGEEPPAETGRATNQRGARAARARLAAAADAELTPDDRRIFDALVAWRLDVSRAAAIPAFVVFDNKVLRSVARSRPASGDDLLAVAGIGPAKLERYGAAVLEIVGRHAASPTV